MPILNLKTLLCIVPEDSGADEAYLVANGVKIWGVKSMNSGQGRTVDKQVNFVNSVDIKLFDKDGPFEKDDFLGTVTVSSTLKGKGEQVSKFLKDGANYSLYYEVV